MKMNNNNMCMVCFQPPDVKPENNMLGEKEVFPLIKHHIAYFPELIAFVHYDCHKKIHDTPLTAFIQYEKGDARKFYEEKKLNEEKRNRRD